MLRLAQQISAVQRRVIIDRGESEADIEVMTLSRENPWFLILKSAHASTLRSEPSGMPTKTISRR